MEVFSNIWNLIQTKRSADRANPASDLKYDTLRNHKIPDNTHARSTLKAVVKIVNIKIMDIGRAVFGAVGIVGRKHCFPRR